MSETRTVYRTCPLCEATCGLSLTVLGERVETVRGDPEDVFSRGYLCPKGAALGELHHDPDRLRWPRVREGGGWREVSWEEAFRRVDEGLAPYLKPGASRDAVGVYLGNPNTHNLAGILFLRPFLKALGTKNLFSAATVDQMPREVACGWLYGSPGINPVPDIDRSHFLLLLGANPLESNGSLWTAPDLPGRLRALRKRGGRLVVVDPIRTRTAQLADLHLAIRPGGDAAWLLALAQTLFEEGLDTPGRLAEHAAGLETLRSWVARFSPERVARYTGIDAETTRRVARDLARAPSAAVYGRMGAHAASFGTLAGWAADVLNFLTGNLDREGGVMVPRPVEARVRDAGAAPGGRGFRVGRWHSRVRGEPERRSEFPAALLAEEIEEPGAGQIRALITVAGNPVLSTPNGARLDAALGTLEFVVCVDPYLNETTRHADLILPPPSALQRSHYDLTYNRAAIRSVAKYSPAVFEPEGPSEAEILARLAAAVGGGTVEQVFADTLRERIEGEVARDYSPIAGRDPAEIASQIEVEDPCDQIVDFLIRTGAYGDAFGVDPEGLTLARLRAEPHGVDFGPMRPALPGALETPDGRLQLAPESLASEIERLVAAVDRPAPSGDLLLVGRRHLRSNNSWLHNLSSLAGGSERCTLWMHPRDTASRGLEDRAPVEVCSEVGRVVVPLEANDAVAPGVVSLPHGYGHRAPGTKMGVAAARPGVSANDLTEGEMDAASGNAVLNGIPVQVRGLG